VENILTKINQAGLKFLEPLSLTQTYTVIIEEAVKLLNADWGSLHLAEKNILNRVAIYPVDAPLPFEPRKNGFSYKAYREQKTFVISEKEIYTMHPEVKKGEYKSAICIPLADHEKSIGTLFLLSSMQQKFTQKDLNLLKLFGSYASLAIRKAKLHEETQQALEARDFFISMAAHELRTPLTAVNGYIQLLYTKLHHSETSEAKWIKNLIWESKRLTLLINELLEVDRIKAGELHYQWNFHNLKIIIERAINNLKFTFPKRTIVYINKVESENDSIVGDFDKILQALTNLLDNAAKFSPTNTDILLTLSSNKHNFIITIQDFGSGIPKDILSRLFEGYTVHRSGDIQGMGLGMYLVKNILRLHKGTINVKTKEKKGTTVKITLPKAT